MKTIIAGSRIITDYDIVKKILNSIPFFISSVISGTAKGVDTLGEKWAKEGYIPIERFPANWSKYGKSAGFRRNIEMAVNADAAIVIWDGKSKGSKNMLDIALQYDLLLWSRKIDTKKQLLFLRR